jgi:hypothetical protein
LAQRSLTRREQLWVLLLVVTTTTLIARWDTLPWDKVFPHERFPVRYEVRDVETNQLIPCKLTFIGVKDTASPGFGAPIPGCDGSTAICSRNRIMSVTGSGTVAVPSGTYDVYVSHGIETNRVIVRNVQVNDKLGADVIVVLRRDIDMSDWISLDTHIHGARSWDSVVTPHERLFQAVSDDLRVLVATDHNVLTDQTPAIRASKLDPYISSLVGEEITPPKKLIGHFNAFPLPVDENRKDLGAVIPDGLTPEQIFAEVRRKSPDAFIVVNHPRAPDTFSYFTWGGFDPLTGKASNPNFSFGFDGVEVLNGALGESTEELDQAVRDWLSLINHGHLVAALGASDSHQLFHNVAGYPRTYVQVKDEPTNRVNAERIVARLKGMHAFVSTGPIIRVKVGSGGIGDLVTAAQGKVKVELQVEAANWISVRNVNVLVNGVGLRSWRVPSSDETVRLKRSFELDFPKDGSIVIEADSNGLLAPIVGGDEYQIHPYAITNPIFIDADGDGKWTPPEQ